MLAPKTMCSQQVANLHTRRRSALHEAFDKADPCRALHIDSPSDIGSQDATVPRQFENGVYNSLFSQSVNSIPDTNYSLSSTPRPDVRLGDRHAMSSANDETHESSMPRARVSQHNRLSDDAGDDVSPDEPMSGNALTTSHS